MYVGNFEFRNCYCMTSAVTKHLGNTMRDKWGDPVKNWVL